MEGDIRSSSSEEISDDSNNSAHAANQNSTPIKKSD